MKIKRKKNVRLMGVDYLENIDFFYMHPGYDNIPDLLHQRQQPACSSVADQEERREIRLHVNRNNTGIFISISLGNDFTRIFSFSALGQKV